jgi:hypothetical protein
MVNVALLPGIVWQDTPRTISLVNMNVEGGGWNCLTLGTPPDSPEHLKVYELWLLQHRA